MQSERVAIGLLTCDRPEYTERTLLSLKQHNDLSRFVLLHGDDASQDSRNRDMGRLMGFELIHAPTERQGQMASLRALVHAAQKRECDYILVLESDYETVHPFPWDAFAIPGWDHFRLFGTRKMREGPRAPTSPRNMGTNELIQWLPVVPGYEFSPAAHWTPDGVTRTALLAEHIHLPRVKDVCLAWRPPSLRVIENVAWHIAETSTPGFKP
jgi:hypothetical protein